MQGTPVLMRITAIAATLVCGLGPRDTPAQDLPTVPLKGGLSADFALNPQTGDLAAVRPDNNTATLYSDAYLRRGKDRRPP